MYVAIVNSSPELDKRAINCPFNVKIEPAISKHRRPVLYEQNISFIILYINTIPSSVAKKYFLNLVEWLFTSLSRMHCNFTRTIALGQELSH